MDQGQQPIHPFRERLTEQQLQTLRDNPTLQDAYACGYQAGLHAALGRIADTIVWNTISAYSLGYRHGWYSKGRPV